MAVVAGFLLALVLLVAAPARAADEPFEIEFDQSDLKIGALGNLLGDGLPLGTVSSGASLKGTIAADGTVTIPKGSFTMPQVGIDDPVKLRTFLGIESPATGTFDRATGQLELDAKAGLWIRVDAGALLDLLGLDVGDLLGGSGSTGGINIGSLVKPLLSNLTCGFSPMDVHFTTGSNSLASGAPFTSGPSGKGAITAEWSQLGPFVGQTKILGLIDPCQMLLDYLPGLIEGGAGGALPGGVDLGGLDLSSLLAGLNNLDLGPSAITLTRTVQTSLPTGTGPGTQSPAGSGTRKARLRLGATAVKRRVRSAAKVRFRVKVRNTGKAAATRVRLCMTGYAIRNRCLGLGRIAAGATKVRVLRPRVNFSRFNGRHQQVLRPRFIATAKGTPRVRIRRASVRLVLR